MKTWRPYFWIVVAGIAVYAHCLFFGFTYLDDNTLILNQQHFLGNISNVFQAFRQDVFYSNSDAYYRPILTVSFMLDAHIGKASPMIYHFTNIVIHLIVSCLVFAFLRKLDHRKELAFVASLFFAVHPVLTQAVAWVPGRNDSLLAVFALASFIFLINYFEANKIRHLIFHFLFFALTFFTKETAVVLPVVMAAYFVLFRRDKSIFRSLIIPGAGWMLISLAWLGLRNAAFQNPLRVTSLDALMSILANSPAVIVYIGKLLLPFNLSVLPILRDSTKIYGSIVIVAVAVFLCISKQKRFNFMFFGSAWFLLFLLLALIQPDIGLVANIREHRVYLPMIGFIVLLLEIDFVKNLNFQRKCDLTAIILLLLSLSLINFDHSRNYRDRLSFWKNATQNSPHSPLAHRNLGAMYYLDGLPDKAEIEYRRALELNPYERMAHNNLGLIYANKNMLKKAEAEYRKEIQINPRYDTVYFNFGLLYFRQGKFKKAEGMWKKTIELNPDYIDAYSNLAVYYYRQNNRERAMYYVDQLEKRGVKVDPKLLKALTSHDRQTGP